MDFAIYKAENKFCDKGELLYVCYNNVIYEALNRYGDKGKMKYVIKGAMVSAPENNYGDYCCATAPFHRA